jgi:cytochrome oxidase Cu insertion factor (SCO1/SenC/PrrC family)
MLLALTTAEFINPSMIRTKPALIPYILAFAAILAGWVWHAGDQVPDFGPAGISGTADIGGPFSLIDQNGKPRTDADFHGRYMLIYFGYSNCPDVCPVSLGVIADAVERLGPLAARVAPIFITVDPERDTPSILKQYLAVFSPKLIGLTGTPKEIRQVVQEYRVYVAKHAGQNGNYSFDHSNIIYLMGPGGKFVADYDETLGPDGLAAALRKHL